MALVVLALLIVNSSAEAYPPFKVQFDKRYMVEGSEMFKAMENGKTNCNLCHVGTNKRKKNAYGMAIDKYLSRDDTTMPERIVEALIKVESDKTGETTFGELIKTGKLPLTKEE